MAKSKRRSPGIFSLLLLIMLLSILPIHVFSEGENDSHRLRITNTVIDSAEAQNTTVFTYIGKFQSGIKRQAVAGDQWYGTAEIVYSEMQILGEAFPFQKIDLQSSEVTDSGTITPNAYGIFSFRLRHNEAIEFLIPKKENLSFYLYETPNDLYTTKAVMAGKEYTGTTYVKTGAVIGVGAVPGGMETRYYEAALFPITREFAPCLHPFEADTVIEYTNTNGNIPVTPTGYTVAYRFESASPDRMLPEEVRSLLPPAQEDIPDQTEVAPVRPEREKIPVQGGEWIFEGYDSALIVIQGADIEFVGRWKWIPEESPAESHGEESGTVPGIGTGIAPSPAPETASGTTSDTTSGATEQVTERVVSESSADTETQTGSSYSDEGESLSASEDLYGQDEALLPPDQEEGDPLLQNSSDALIPPEANALVSPQKSSGAAWVMIFLFVTLSILLGALCISLLPDVHVLRWYAKKRKETW